MAPRMCRQARSPRLTGERAFRPARRSRIAHAHSLTKASAVPNAPEGAVCEVFGGKTRETRGHAPIGATAASGRRSGWDQKIIAAWQTIEPAARRGAITKAGRERAAE